MLLHNWDKLLLLFFGVLPHLDPAVLDQVFNVDFIVVVDVLDDIIDAELLIKGLVQFRDLEKVVVIVFIQMGLYLTLLQVVYPGLQQISHVAQFLIIDEAVHCHFGDYLLQVRPVQLHNSVLQGLQPVLYVLGLAYLAHSPALLEDESVYFIPVLLPHPSTLNRLNLTSQPIKIGVEALV